jgi:Holliday junction resolvase-like predicted endonuclease
MENLSNEHGQEVFILAESPPPGVAVRPLQSLRVTVPDNGEPWPVVIRNARGKPVTGLWVSEADILALACAVIERRPGAGGVQVTQFPASGITSAVDAAAEYLVGAGLIVHDRGWCCDDGGLSIVAQERDQLVAVYLKFAADGRYLSSLNELGEKTFMEVLLLAAAWCKERSLLFPQARVDVLGMGHQAGGWVIEHVRGVTQ